MSVSVKMTSADKRKFANDIKKFSKEAGRSVEESIARTAAFTASEAKKIVPVDKGFLKNSIRARKERQIYMGGCHKYRLRTIC